VFVTLEGIDRSGKTTQAALLAKALGSDTVLLREPGGTEVGERVRAILKDPALELTSGAELMLFSAARSQLASDVVAPALEAGRHVVCDRYIDSTVAYQGVARDLGVELVEQLNALVVGSCVPDVTVLIRVEVDTALVRGRQRLAEGAEDGTDRFEAEGAEFQRRVAAAYDDLARRHPERITVVDGEGSPEDVHARVLAAVGQR
jgi:dTMP kinase